MGHLAGKKAYRDLQQRLNRISVGAPANRASSDKNGVQETRVVEAEV